jgi:hypothetical protein
MLAGEELAQVRKRLHQQSTMQQWLNIIKESVTQ